MVACKLLMWMVYIRLQSKDLELKKSLKFFHSEWKIDTLTDVLKMTYCIYYNLFT